MNCSSFETLVDREAPDIEQEPVTMIHYDQQSRWKSWMRLLAVDIRPISMSMLRKSTSLSIGVMKPQRLPILYVKVEGASVTDTAVRTGMSESAVKVGIHRGLKALAERIRSSG
jgi:hypothetical protein